MAVTREEIRAARTADLYDFLLFFHPGEFIREGHWLRMKRNPGLCMKRGCGGYKDYATGATGNSIDFLIAYMNYDFQTAVTSLVKSGTATSPKAPQSRTVIFPEKAGDASAVRAYLSGRGFPKKTLDKLLAANLLYQDVRRNAVFCSSAGDFYELRGTWPGKVFHQCRKRTSDCFWFFTPEGPPEKAYICESAIDAVSLYLLHLQNGFSDGAGAYCSIAGVANQKSIERISAWLPSVLAVDNDVAGQECRHRNSNMPALIPQKKDWNEDLLATIATVRV